MGKNGVRINLYDLQIYYFYDEQLGARVLSK